MVAKVTMLKSGISRPNPPRMKSMSINTLKKKKVKLNNGIKKKGKVKTTKVMTQKIKTIEMTLKQKKMMMGKKSKIIKPANDSIGDSESPPEALGHVKYTPEEESLNGTTITPESLDDVSLTTGNPGDAKLKAVSVNKKKKLKKNLKKRNDNLKKTKLIKEDESFSLPTQSKKKVPVSVNKKKKLKKNLKKRNDNLKKTKLIKEDESFSLPTRSKKKVPAEAEPSHIAELSGFLTIDCLGENSAVTVDDIDEEPTPMEDCEEAATSANSSMIPEDSLADALGCDSSDSEENEMKILKKQQNKLENKKRKKKKKDKMFYMKERRNFEKMTHIVKKERALAEELFGDLSKTGENEDEGRLFDIPKGINEIKTKTKIPDDPFDIHVSDKSGRKPAWVDEDDEKTRVMDVMAKLGHVRGTNTGREVSKKKYQVELREKFSNVIGCTQDWAELTNKPEEDSDEDNLIKRTGNYLSGSAPVSLPKLRLDYKKLPDLNSSHSEGQLIQFIDFNPNQLVGLVAGVKNRTGMVSLFQVDGVKNHRIHSVRFPRYSLTSGQFLRDGKKFILGARAESHFYIYDIEAAIETKFYADKREERSIDKNVHVSPDGELLVFIGRRGKMHLYDVKTLAMIDILQAPFRINAATFNCDGSRMYTHGESGEVFVWDMNARQAINKFYDDGCINGTAITMSPNNQYIACGSSSGIVNVYDTSQLLDMQPTPVKVLSNLRTAVSSLTFNGSSEILAMSSIEMPDAIKLVHFPSMSVFKNFPLAGINSKYGDIARKYGPTQFSPQSGYFAVGNSDGAAHMYRLKHFSSY